jgi:hypothetical protein
MQMTHDNLTPDAFDGVPPFVQQVARDALDDQWFHTALLDAQHEQLGRVAADTVDASDGYDWRHESIAQSVTNRVMNRAWYAALDALANGETEVTVSFDEVLSEDANWEL